MIQIKIAPESLEFLCTRQPSLPFVLSLSAVRRNALRKSDKNDKNLLRNVLNIKKEGSNVKKN